MRLRNFHGSQLSSFFDFSTLYTSFATLIYPSLSRVSCQSLVRSNINFQRFGWLAVLRIYIASFETKYLLFLKITFQTEYSVYLLITQHQILEQLLPVCPRDRSLDLLCS